MAAPPTQALRLLAVTTPLGADTLLLTGLHGTEGVSQLFSFTLETVAENTKEVAFDKLLGQPLSARLTLADGKKQRFFTGICAGASQGGSDQRYTTYHLELVPQVWLLTRKAQSRIFQHVTVPDILKKVFQGFDVEWKIEGTFQPRDYCVQYRETDFAFASRLMEEEGIYYYFKHANGSHKMCVANTPAGFADNPEIATALYETPQQGKRDDDRISRWSKRQELRAGKVTLWDHCFELPHKHLEAEKSLQESVTVGKVTHKLLVGPNGKLEKYDYPGAYAQRFDGIDKGGAERPADVQKIFTDNKRTVEIRIQEEAATGVRIAAASSCRHLTAGHKFTLTTNPADKLALMLKAEGPYVLLTVTHQAEQPAYASAAGTGFEYHNTFACIPAAMPFRPARVTPRPVIPGTQTAVVVGPKGEEIFTDKYGRVKAQFHWDRDGTNDPNSSCWLRVSTLWAGKQWGMIHVPRIGQEVIVGFEEGDPDRPIVLGNVYNADQMVPYKLPDHKTQSGIKSRSTLDGTPDNFNEIRFEDKKGHEEVYIHAEKDMNSVVEHDQTHTVYHNQTISVGLQSKGGPASNGTKTETIMGDTKVTITKGNFNFDVQTGTSTTHVKGDVTENYDAKLTTHIVADVTQNYDAKQTTTVKNDQFTHVTSGSHLVKVDSAHASLHVDSGNRFVVVGSGFYDLIAAQYVQSKVGGNFIKIDQSGQIGVEATAEILLKVGGNTIKIDAAGIHINGNKIDGTASGNVEFKGAEIDLNC